MLAMVPQLARLFNIGPPSLYVVYRGSLPTAAMVRKSLRAGAARRRSAHHNHERRLRLIDPSRGTHSIQMQISMSRFHKEYRFNQSSS